MYKKIEIYKYTEVYIVINKIKITCINKINIYIYILESIKILNIHKNIISDFYLL